MRGLTGPLLIRLTLSQPQFGSGENYLRVWVRSRKVLSLKISFDQEETYHIPVSLHQVTFMDHPLHVPLHRKGLFELRSEQGTFGSIYIGKGKEIYDRKQRERFDHGTPYFHSGQPFTN